MSRKNLPPKFKKFWEEVPVDVDFFLGECPQVDIFKGFRIFYNVKEYSDCCAGDTKGILETIAEHWGDCSVITKALELPENLTKNEWGWMPMAQWSMCWHVAKALSVMPQETIFIRWGGNNV